MRFALLTEVPGCVVFALIGVMVAVSALVVDVVVLLPVALDLVQGLAVLS